MKTREIDRILWLTFSPIGAALFALGAVFVYGSAIYPAIAVNTVSPDISLFTPPLIATEVYVAFAGASLLIKGALEEPSMFEIPRLALWLGALPSGVACIISARLLFHKWTILPGVVWISLDSLVCAAFLRKIALPYLKVSILALLIVIIGVAVVAVAFLFVGGHLYS